MPAGLAAPEDTLRFVRDLGEHLMIKTFAQALALAGEKPHVLLGNGFSRACKDDIFAYGALFDQADFAKLSPFAKEAFKILETTDFEEVMEVLRKSSDVVRLYDPKAKGLSAQLKKDADGLKGVLVHAIAHSHPDLPSDISDEAYGACRKFLSNFSRIYTLNYDLLLYWALMKDELPPEVPKDDGFRSPDDPDTEYVTWEPGRHGQNIYFLHGGLHIFDGGHEIQKYTWSRSKAGVRLMVQIRAALDRDLYPVFVAEGESKQKMRRIRHNDYLSKCYRSFQEIGGSLFIHGHSMAENDDHFLRLITKGKIAKLFVGIHGDPASPGNKKIIARANAIAAARLEKKPLAVDFYDSSTARVWG